MPANKKPLSTNAAPAVGWGRPSAYVVAVLLLLGGQALLFRGSTGPALWLSALGLLALGGIWIGPGFVQGLAVRRSLRGEPATWKAAGSPAARTAVKPAAAQPAPSRGLLDFLQGRRDLLPIDTVSLPRWVYLAAAGLCGALAQLMLMRGSISVPYVLLGAALLLVVVYFQALERPLEIPHLNHNLRALLVQVPGLVLQAWGAVLLWDYVYMLSGFALVIVGGTWTLAVLRRWPLRLVVDESAGEPRDLLHYPDPVPFYGQGRLWWKLGLVLGAVVLWRAAVQVYQQDHQGVAFTMQAFSLFCLMASFPWSPYAASNAPFLPEALRPWSALALALLAVALGAHGQTLIERAQTGPGMAYFFAGAVAMVLGWRPGDPADRGSEADWLRADWMRKLEYLAVLALMLMTFYMRAHRINIFPFAAEGDEAGGGLLAYDILRGHVENMLVHQNIPLFPFEVSAVFIKYFGLSVGTMRWHAVLFGSLSVLSTYFFLRLAFGRLAAFGATLLMSLAYWHIHFSRFGHFNIEQVFYQMAAFYFIFRGIRDNRYWHFVVGGAAFGFAMLPHLSSRLLPFGGIALLIYWFMGRRDLLRSRATGLAAFVLSAWIVASPALTFWIRVIPLSMGRVQSVSIFDRTNTNAPADVYAGFAQNVRSSLLMFNYQADSRPRDNPVAPDKILERWTAVAFMLALLYVAYWWRQPIYFFLLAVFSIFLSASFFSVEAPQTLRTAGNISIVFAILAGPLFDLRRALRPVGRGLGVLVLALIVLPTFSYWGYRSWHRYFVDEAGQQFDVLPTVIADRAGHADPKRTQAVFYATGFGAGHPPVMLFSKDTPIRNYYDFTESLPVHDEWGQDHLEFFADEYLAAVPWFRQMYPSAKEETYKDPRNGQVLYTDFLLTYQEQLKYQGLKAVGQVGGRAVALEGQPLQWPLPGLEGASRVHFSGGLYIPRMARWAPRLQGPGTMTFRVDGKPWVGSARALAIGVHSIEADLRPGPAGISTTAYMDAPPYNNGIFFNLRSSATAELGLNLLLRQGKPQGWYSRYWVNPTWDGDPVTELVQPMMLCDWLDAPLPGQWSSISRARLRVDQTGTYAFNANTAAYSEVWVDNKMVARSGALPVAFDRPQPKGPQVLSKGWHLLEYRFSTAGPPTMRVEWTGPGVSGVILPERLEPVFP